jgi:hypothetical protein
LLDFEGLSKIAISQNRMTIKKKGGSYVSLWLSALLLETESFGNCRDVFDVDIVVVDDVCYTPP